MQTFRDTYMPMERSWRSIYSRISWVAVLLWMGAIFVSSSYPVPETVARVPDKGLHFAAYFILGFLYGNAFTTGFQSRLKLRHVVWATALSTAFGALDEWHQNLVPTRDMSAADVLFDGIGSAGAAIVCWLATRMQKEGHSG